MSAIYVMRAMVQRKASPEEGGLAAPLVDPQEAAIKFGAKWRVRVWGGGCAIFRLVMSLLLLTS